MPQQTVAIYALDDNGVGYINGIPRVILRDGRIYYHITNDGNTNINNNWFQVRNLTPILTDVKSNPNSVEIKINNFALTANLLTTDGPTIPLERERADMNGAPPSSPPQDVFHNYPQPRNRMGNRMGGAPKVQKVHIGPLGGKYVIKNGKKKYLA